MPLITAEKLNRFAQHKLSQSDYRYDSRTILFTEPTPTPHQSFDIFLCHSSLDSDLILGLKEYFDYLDYSAYIDWYNDPQLDRTYVNRNTADTLRNRMAYSQCLFFASSPNSPNSKWMPWECGYFDGIKGKVAICPIVESFSTTEDFQGQEYLGLYPYVTSTRDASGNEQLWINEAADIYVSLSNWLLGMKPYKHK